MDLIIQHTYEYFPLTLPSKVNLVPTGMMLPRNSTSCVLIQIYPKNSLLKYIISSLRQLTKSVCQNSRTYTRAYQIKLGLKEIPYHTYIIGAVGNQQGILIQLQQKLQKQLRSYLPSEDPSLELHEGYSETWNHSAELLPSQFLRLRCNHQRKLLP